VVSVVVVGRERVAREASREREREREVRSKK